MADMMMLWRATQVDSPRAIVAFSAREAQKVRLPHSVRTSPADRAPTCNNLRRGDAAADAHPGRAVLHGRRVEEHVKLGLATVDLVDARAHEPSDGASRAHPEGPSATMKIPTFDTAPKEKAYSGYGKALLTKMGWKEGDGLGKHRQGMSEAIKVKKREDQQGLGADEALRYKWEEKWWEGHFASAADKFARAVAAHADSSDSDNSDSDSDSDDDMARNLAACAVDHNGNAVITTGKVKGRDGIYYSGKKSDFDLAKDLQQEAKGGGGFFGRAKGKLARIASMEAEQLAKYGIQAGEPLENLEDKPSGSSDGSDLAPAAAKGAPGTPSPEPEPEPLTGEAYEGVPSESTKELKWWVNARFQWGGVAGSARDKSADVPTTGKRGFTEDDQEALFNAAHSGKVEKGAKRGLGGKGRIKSEHTGIKMKFSEDGELLAGGVRAKGEAAKPAGGLPEESKSDGKKKSKDKDKDKSSKEKKVSSKEKKPSKGSKEKKRKSEDKDKKSEKKSKKSKR